MKVKIIQFQAMPNDATWQGVLIGLGDDGVMYYQKDSVWCVFMPLEFKEAPNDK